MKPILLCYRLHPRMDYDEEIIWAYVQRSGGSLSIKSYCIDFWIPAHAEVLLLCAWPDLERVARLDYI